MTPHPPGKPLLAQGGPTTLARSPVRCLSPSRPAFACWCTPGSDLRGAARPCLGKEAPAQPSDLSGELAGIPPSAPGRTVPCGFQASTVCSPSLPWGVELPGRGQPPAPPARPCGQVPHPQALGCLPEEVHQDHHSAHRNQTTCRCPAGPQRQSCSTSAIPRGHLGASAPRSLQPKPIARCGRAPESAARLPFSSGTTVLPGPTRPRLCSDSSPLSLLST